MRHVINGRIKKIIKYNSLKSAFTLAEILITLGIIGVVAAITIPGLINSYQDKVIVTSLQETYSILQQAYKMSMAENDPISSWDLSSDKNDAKSEIIDKFLPYIKTYSICNTNSSKKCNYKMIVDLNGEETNNEVPYNLILGNSVKINIDDIGGYSAYLWSDDCNKHGGCIAGISDSMLAVHTIMVNVTGRENKPMWGRDLFLFAILDDGIIPFGDVGWHKTSNCNPTGKSTSGWWNGATCAGYVLKYKNVNYLKCTRGQQKYCTGNYNP